MHHPMPHGESDHGGDHAHAAEQDGFLVNAAMDGKNNSTAGGTMTPLKSANIARPTTTRIGGASLALGLMAAGAGLQFASMAQSKTLTTLLLLIRHMLLPLAAFGLARLFGLSALQSTVLLTFSALPTASSAYVLAARMGYNGAYVAGLVTLSTVLGMLSLPFALSVLR